MNLVINLSRGTLFVLQAHLCVLKSNIAVSTNVPSDTIFNLMDAITLVQSCMLHVARRNNVSRLVIVVAKGQSILSRRKKPIENES
jgi:hypothetical protein